MFLLEEQSNFHAKLSTGSKAIDVICMKAVRVSSLGNFSNKAIHTLCTQPYRNMHPFSVVSDFQDG